MSNQYRKENISQNRNFYEEINREIYSARPDLESHPAFKPVSLFIEQYQLTDKKCLEIGSSTGTLQDLVADYTGMDISKSLEKYYRKPFYVVNADGSYPFPDTSFDAIWSFAVHEHIQDLQQALLEIKRILKSGGLIFFWPAWFCPFWAAEGYAVRPYSDLGIKGKIIKALIPLRSSLIWRSMFVFPKRIYRHALFLLGRRYPKILYKPLKANYENFWLSDSDACNHMDPHDSILWFKSNGFRCLSHQANLSILLVRHEPLILEKA